MIYRYYGPSTEHPKYDGRGYIRRKGWAKILEKETYSEVITEASRIANELMLERRFPCALAQKPWSSYRIFVVEIYMPKR